MRAFVCCSIQMANLTVWPNQGWKQVAAAPARSKPYAPTFITSAIPEPLPMVVDTLDPSRLLCSTLYAIIYSRNLINI
jgi:hypothetical protein